MKKIPSFIFILLLTANNLFAQNDFPWDIHLEAVPVNGLTGIHSFAYARHDGKWLIVGGRLDGLHARQPFSSFPAAENNTSFMVIDPEAGNYWTASFDGLSTAVAEHLQSTNMNFCQVADTLYIIGGYAYSASADDHITFPRLTTLQVSEVMNAVINGQAPSGGIHSITDENFAVTGGHLAYLNGKFHLVGGHRFDGRYNPMGMPTYTQTYSNQIRTFSIHLSPELSFADYSSITDAANLHRRDYNLLPQIFPDGTEGLTISSGVFQVNADLPYLNPVDIIDGNIYPVNEFSQYLSHYHAAHASMFDASSNSMHNLFFGGMSQYHYVNGELVQDDLVPFIKTISLLSRTSDGSLHEYQMPQEMPELSGAGAEFILSEEIPQTTSEIILLPSEEDSIVIGYILGGIQSSMENPFSSNQTAATSASPVIYRVSLVRNDDNRIPEVSGKHAYSFAVFPNPVREIIHCRYELKEACTVDYVLTSPNGNLVSKGIWSNSRTGKCEEDIQLPEGLAGGLYTLTLVFDHRYFVQRTIAVSAAK